MKRSPKPKPRQPKKLPIQVSRPLIERRFPYTRFVELPQIKGRSVEKIEIFTAPEYNSITIDFQDKTALTLTIDPYFKLGAELSDIKSGDQQTIQEWPPIHSVLEPIP